MARRKNGNADPPPEGGADESLETGEDQEDGEDESQGQQGDDENSGNEEDQQDEGGENKGDDKDTPPEDTGPTPPASDNSERTEGGVEVISAKRAGKTIVAVTGNPITFDKDGKATVDPRYAEYLNTLSGFGKEK
jgi:hypothetical protein